MSRGRLTLPASQQLLATLDGLSAAWGVERTQLGAVALAVGLRALAGTGVAPVGIPGAHVGTELVPEGIPGAPGTPCFARARAAACLPADASKKQQAAPERGKPDAADLEARLAELDREDQEALEEAIAWRIQEDGPKVRDPARFRLRLLADWLAPGGAEEVNAVLDRKDRATAPKKTPIRKPGLDPV